MKKKLNKNSLNGFINYGIVIAAFAVIQVLLGMGRLSNSLQSLLVPACCYIVMAVSLNLTVGILGELSLGHAGFMSLGAFSGIVASILLQHAIPMAPLRLAVSMAVGAVFGAIGGVIVGVPVLRLQGDYLAIVTLAFGQIIKNIIMVLYVGVDSRGIHLAASKDRFDLAAVGNAIIKGTPQDQALRDVYGNPIDVPQENLFLYAGVMVLLTFIPLFFAWREYDRRIRAKRVGEG